MQERKRLEQSIANDDRIRSMTDDLDTLFELAREGENVNGDIQRDLKSYGELLERLETAMLLSGENDARSAIVTIHPGAGGTESQDWAEMLLRMYLRWAERDGFQTVITDRLALARQFEHGVQVVGEAADAIVVGDRLFQTLAVLHDLLAFFGLTPEVRRGDLLFGFG